MRQRCWSSFSTVTPGSGRASATPAQAALAFAGLATAGVCRVVTTPGSARAAGSRVRGPLAPWAGGFERWLAARGYARWSVRKRVCQLARLSCWLEREGLAVWELNEQSAELFVASRREAGYVTWVTSRCMEL